MFWRYAVPLLIAGVFASLLLGWAIAYWHDRRSKEREREEDEAMRDYEEKNGL
jgi:Mg2+/citrate symporter